jgi:hypothetical protein
MPLLSPSRSMSVARLIARGCGARCFDTRNALKSPKGSRLVVRDFASDGPLLGPGARAPISQASEHSLNAQARISVFGAHAANKPDGYVLGSYRIATAPEPTPACS